MPGMISASQVCPYEVPNVRAEGTVVYTALRDATGRALNRVPVTPDELVGLRGPAVSAGPPPPVDVPGQSPVPYYYGMRSGQQRLM